MKLPREKSSIGTRLGCGTILLIGALAASEYTGLTDLNGMAAQQWHEYRLGRYTSTLPIDQRTTVATNYLRRSLGEDFDPANLTNEQRAAVQYVADLCTKGPKAAIKGMEKPDRIFWNECGFADTLKEAQEITDQLP